MGLNAHNLPLRLELHGAAGGVEIKLHVDQIFHPLLSVSKNRPEALMSRVTELSPPSSLTGKLTCSRASVRFVFSVARVCKGHLFFLERIDSFFWEQVTEEIRCF